MSINSRLSEVLTVKKISQGELSKKVGGYPSNISNIINGRRSQPLEFVIALLQLFKDIDARWYLTGEGQMYYNEKYHLDRVVKECGSYQNDNKMLDEIIRLASENGSLKVLNTALDNELKEVKRKLIEAEKKIQNC